jgi:predicted nucleotidyltransferase
MLDAAFYEQVRDRLVAAFPDVVRVVLFGSRATGRATPDSDVDLLVVLPGNDRPALRAARVRLALRGLPVAFDLVVLSPDEFERSRAWKSSVVAAALAHGRVLHEAA